MRSAVSRAQSAASRGIASFLLGPPPPPAVSASSDRLFCQRLLEVYLVLKAANQLVTPLPAGVADEFTVDGLQQSPPLQVMLVASTSYTPSKWLLEQELTARQANGANPGTAQPSWQPDGGEDVYDAAARERLRGLCFSGGGIRSATFNLGVLQGLAANGKLDHFDYLSTVSGGGYIHQWLASWILRDPGGMTSVKRRIVAPPDGAAPARTPEPIKWLRRYSSYLTPRRGLLTPDTWTMIATWFRNTVLNQIVLCSALALGFFLLQLLGTPFSNRQPVAGPQLATAAGPQSTPSDLPGLALIALVLVSIAGQCVRFSRALYSVKSAAGPRKAPAGAMDDCAVVTNLVLPALVLSMVAALEAAGCLTLLPTSRFPALLFCFAAWILGMTMAATFGGGVLESYRDTSGRGRAGLGIQAGVTLAALLSAAVAIAAGAWMAGLHMDQGRLHSDPARLEHASQRAANWIWERCCAAPAPDGLEVHIQAPAVTSLQLSLKSGAAPAITAHPEDRLANILLAIFAPLAFFCLPFIALRLQTGLAGRLLAESRREWLARFGGWSALLSIYWMAGFAVTYFGPWLMRNIWEDPGHWKAVGASVLALGTHLVTLTAGASGKSDGKPKPEKLLGYSAMDLVGLLGAPVCILILLLAISGLTGLAFQALRHYGCHCWPLPGFGLGLLAILLIFGWRVDVNEFSMHGFYRNRLARCYLGATDPGRAPDPFTHLDDHDAGTRTGIKVCQLLPRRFGGEATCGAQPYDGPFPIFCSTINLTFGQDLGWQDRKGASFAFTPLLSGYHVGWTAGRTSGTQAAATSFNGFVPTTDYAYTGGGVSLATVAAISGAALSPNQGYNSNAPLAFLMTLFNARLGWWLANPRKPAVWPAAKNRATPKMGFAFLVRELLGLTDDTSSFVCLSDGGQFENMGLYELVRRRVRHIVICDAEQDTEMSFAGIGMAIARCRTDFGAEIDLKLDSLRRDEKTNLSSVHFVTGTIQYPPPPGQSSNEDYEGTVVYLKTSVCGDEPGDILHYRLTNPQFPQDPTINQWFTELQFESYRRLGQFIAEKAAGAL